MHIPTRYRANTTIHSIRIILKSQASRGREAARHVVASDQHVQNRGRLSCAVSGYRTHGSRSSAIRRVELHGLRNGANTIHARGPEGSVGSWQVGSWCSLRSRRTDHHIPIRCPPTAIPDQYHERDGIVRTEGLRGMYKGIVPNLLKVAPSMASSWLSFEMTRDMLMGKWNSGFL
jgi:hypothetical protein